MNKVSGMALAGLIAASLSGQVQTGPAVGAQVPRFELPDQHGVMRSFESLRGPKGLVLAFVRSADW
jgi:hypothetical protein